ncbi:MAG: hypothetical protein ACR2RE_28360, partial [Geminicoccaceae bacterium]
MILKANADSSKWLLKSIVSMTMITLSLVCTAVVHAAKPGLPAARGMAPHPNEWSIETVGKDGGTVSLKKGKIQLPASFKHRHVPGNRHNRGQFFKDGGIQIDYVIGRIPPSGGLGLCGDFSNSAANMPKKDRVSLDEREVAGQPVSIAVGKGNLVHASFPRS